MGCENYFQMDYSLPFPQAIASLLGLIVIYILWQMSSKNPNNMKIQAPEPFGAWPVIGHLHHLGGKIQIFRVVSAMADKHGPVFTIRLGTRRVIVISSWEAVKDCFHTNDKVFLTRPDSATRKYMGYDGALLGFAPYGPYWRETRKLAIRELLSHKRIELLKNVRVTEVKTCIEDLYSLCTSNASGSAMVDMSQWFSVVIMNTMLRMIAGKRYCSIEKDRESERLGRCLKQFMYLSGVFVLSDVIPWIEWLDLQGNLRSMKSNAKELDEFMSSWLEEHIKSQREGKVKEEGDFMDVMLSTIEADASLYGHKKETVIKATALNLIVAGADSTSITLTWALSLLMNHVKVLTQAQTELDIHVGKERLVAESDINNLVYLQAIVKETLRLYPPGPLSAPREAMEDCYVGGYYVPKGTRLLVNIWKLHRDPRVWPNPCKFQPDRFLSDHAELDMRGQNFKYIPFSSGRRLCPGISSAIQMLSFTLARLLQSFNLSTPMNKQVDMKEGLGLTMPKATPLELILTPRLPHKLYHI